MLCMVSGVCFREGMLAHCVILSGCVTQDPIVSPLGLKGLCYPGLCMKIGTQMD